MFQSVAIGTMGTEAYVAFLQAEGEPDLALIDESIENLRRLLDDYVDDSMKSSEFGWDAAAESLQKGTAAMFFHGDWTGGHLQQLGWDAGIDYGVTTAPGGSDLFLFIVDVFAIHVDAVNKDAALDFFRTVGSKEGQVAFNTIKGSTPISTDVPRSELTPVGRETLEDLESAKYVLNIRSSDELDAAVLTFAKGGSAEVLRETLVEFFYDTP